MYVKVTAGEGHGDFIQKVETDQLESGSVTIPWPESDGNVLYAAAEALDVSIGTGQLLEVTPHQTVYEQNKGMLVIRYVMWHRSTGMHMVVTTRNIFIVGEDGKTIDRVR